MSELHDRVERGEAIARTPGAVEHVTGSVYAVRAQSGLGVYLVTFEGGRGKCTCPDFTTHSLACKHVVAARIMRSRGGSLPPTQSRHAGPDRRTDRIGPPTTARRTLSWSYSSRSSERS